MFGYEGETNEQLFGMLAKRADARARWPFLTTLDLSMIHNPAQLASMVKDRTGRTQGVAENDVQSWLAGRAERKLSKVTVMQRWLDDGGSTRSGHRT